MPPPMPNPSKRMTAQPSRPVARYRPGKPAAEEESSDEDESEEEQQQQPQRKSAPRPQVSRPTVQAEAEEEDEDEDEEGFVTDPEDEDDGGVQIPAERSAQPTQQQIPLSRPPPAIKPETEDEEASESDSEASASETESEASSSSEEPQRKFQRPTFIRKTERTTSTSQTPNPTNSTNPDNPDPDDTRARHLLEAESHIATRIQQDALARTAALKAWDDDDAPESMVDDTDGLDPAAEHTAWRLRELKRLKRDREAMLSREKEIEELERRRNLTAAEREAEDQEHIDKQREEKDSRGQSGYLARYHHKGAFFQDDAMAEMLKKRDVMGARFEDEVDKSALPEYMRIRDMNKLGKKGRTRYTDLRGEDTGRWGDDVKKWKGAGGDRGRGQDGFDADLRGVDERFLPDNLRSGPSASGANASALGERRGTQRPRRRSYSRPRSRSRSRSPQRRKRSPSYDRRADDEDRGKRRRVVDAV